MKNHPFILITLAALALFALIATASADEGGDCCEPNCDDYAVTLQSAQKLPNGDVKWMYVVTAQAGKDISHITFGVCPALDVIDASPAPWEVGLDPTTGVYGVKFDAGQPAPSVWEYWFVTRGDNRIGDQVAAVKAGCGDCEYPVQGPVCAPNAVSVISIEAHRASVWDALTTWLRGLF